MYFLITHQDMFTKKRIPWFLYPSFICSKHCLHFILRSCSAHNPFLIVMESKYPYVLPISQQKHEPGRAGFIIKFLM